RELGKVEGEGEGARRPDVPPAAIRGDGAGTSSPPCGAGRAAPASPVARATRRAPRVILAPRSAAPDHKDRRRSRSALAMTDTELSVMARLASMGLRSLPVQRSTPPAAPGTPSAL